MFGNRVGDRLNEAKYFNGENIPSYRGNSQRHAPAQQPTGPHSFASIATAV
jgi:hypothetical protein